MWKQTKWMLVIIIILFLCNKFLSVDLWIVANISLMLQYFVSFLQKNLSLDGKLRQYVQWCLENCKNTKVSCRQLPPSSVEIAAMKKLGTIVCRLVYCVVCSWKPQTSFCFVPVSLPSTWYWRKVINSGQHISDSSSWMVAQRPLMFILGTQLGMPCRSWLTALAFPAWKVGPYMSQEAMGTNMSRATSTSMMLYPPGRRKFD